MEKNKKIGFSSNSNSSINEDEDNSFIMKNNEEDFDENPQIDNLEFSKDEKNETDIFTKIDIPYKNYTENSSMENNRINITEEIRELFDNLSIKTSNNEKNKKKILKNIVNKNKKKRKRISFFESTSANEK